MVLCGVKVTGDKLTKSEEYQRINLSRLINQLRLQSDVGVSGGTAETYIVIGGALCYNQLDVSTSFLPCSHDVGLPGTRSCRKSN